MGLFKEAVCIHFHLTQRENCVVCVCVCAAMLLIQDGEGWRARGTPQRMK